MFYGAAPRPREAIRRLCPVVGSWPGKDITTRAARALETELTAAGIPHDLKVYPGARHSFFNDQGYEPEVAGTSRRPAPSGQPGKQHGGRGARTAPADHDYIVHNYLSQLPANI